MADILRRDRLRSLLKFGLVGGLTVGLDAGVYAILAAFGVDLNIAKATSFATGAVFAYFANWRFTFGERMGRFSEVSFVIIYVLALGINVALNAAARAVLGEGSLSLVFAFVFATGCSALWNYIGMSLFVFRTRSSSDREPPKDVHD